MILQPHHTNDLLYRSQQQMREQQKKVLQDTMSDLCATRERAIEIMEDAGYITPDDFILL